MTHKTLIKALAPAALVVLAARGDLLAGSHRVNTVVTVGSTYAFGSIGGTRNSADSWAYLGCETYAYPGGSSGSCFARDAAGTTSRSCNTSDPDMLREIRSIDDGSYVYFTLSGSTCTVIEHWTSSEYEPKGP